MALRASLKGQRVVAGGTLSFLGRGKSADVKNSTLRTIFWRNGKALVVGWNPDLNDGISKLERTYAVEGRESLTECEWEELNVESGWSPLLPGESGTAVGTDA